MAQSIGDLLWVALLTGSVPAALALATYGHSARQAQLDRRRQLYGEAVRAAMGWVEGYYRIRRRLLRNVGALIKHMHDLWDEVAFHQAWLATEAPALGWSYSQFVNQIKQSVGPLLTEAWAKQPHPMSDELPADENRPEALPEVIRARDRFLEDIRQHQSIWPWNRRKLYRRYRAELSQATIVANMTTVGLRSG